MIKLVIKEKRDGVLATYMGKHTNTFEHMFGIAKLYMEIKKNRPEVTDKEIKEVVKELIERMEEEING